MSSSKFQQTSWISGRPPAFSDDGGLTLGGRCRAQPACCTQRQPNYQWGGGRHEIWGCERRNNNNNNNNNNKVNLYTAPKSKKSTGAAAQSNSTCVLSSFWTVRSLQPLAAQQANSSRLVGRRLRTIYHRALSLSLVPQKLKPFC